MYQRFKITNFRCFRELTIENLDRVNLITGVNNVGKTALLEALFLHCGARNPELTLRLDPFRGVDTIRIQFGPWKETIWDSLFNNFDSTKTIELDGVNDVAGHRKLRLKVVRELEEITPSGQFIQREMDKAESVALLSEGSQVLELAYEENGKKGKHQMVLDSKGVRVTPMFPPPPFQTIFLPSRIRISVTEDSERFGTLEKLGQQDVLVKALKVIESRLNRLAVVVDRGTPMLHGDIGFKRLVPLPVMGDGMARLASLVLAIGNSQNGVVLLDEIENGLHHSVLSKVWIAISKVAQEFNTQIFATTHSLECIVAAHKAFTKSGEYNFRLHRLERTKETIKMVTYDKETLESAIETDLEIR